MLTLFLLSSCTSPRHMAKKAQRYYRSGQILLSEGKSDPAIKKFKKSMALAKQAGFSKGVAHNLNELAIIQTSKGDFTEARKLLSQALEIYITQNMKTEVSKTLNNIASTHIKENNFVEALLSYKELMRWDKDSGNQLGAAITYSNMGSIYEKYLSKPEKAYENYIKALNIFKGLKKEKFVRMLEQKLQHFPTQNK